MLQNTNKILKYQDIISLLISIFLTIIIFIQLTLVKNTLLGITEENIKITGIVLSSIPMLSVVVLIGIVTKINKIINSYSLQYKRDVKFFKQAEVISKEKLEKSNYDNLLLKNQIRNYENSSIEHQKEIEYLNTKVHSLKDQVFKVTSDLEISKKKEDTSKEVDALSTTILSLKEENKSLVSLVESQKNLLEKVQVEEEQKDNSITDLKKKLEIEKAIQLNLNETISNLKIEAHKDKKEIEQLEKEKQIKYIKENSIEKDKIEKLQSSYKRATSEIKELKGMLRLKDKEIKILNKKISTVDKIKPTLLSGVIEKNKKEKNSKIKKILQDKNSDYDIPFEQVFWKEQEENEEE